MSHQVHTGYRIISQQRLDEPPLTRLDIGQVRLPLGIAHARRWRRTGMEVLVE